MDDEFFDPLADHIDGELRRRFDAAAPRTAGDPDAVLDSMRPQMRRARTRHRVAIGGIVAGVLALVVVAGAALTGGNSDPGVNTPPASRSDGRPAVTVTTLPVTPSPPVDNTEIKQEGTNGGGAFTGTTNGSGGTGGSESSGSSSGGETATTVPAPQTQSYGSAGGSITVALADGSLSLGSTSPAAGQFAKVNKSSGTTVEVEFYARADFSGPRTSRIRVDLVDGAMVPTID